MKIACIGNAVFDFTVRGEEFIVEGVRNSFDNASYNPGGPASNAAYVLAKFGNLVDFYGQVGNDVNGRYVREEMEKSKVNINHLHLSDYVMTPFSFVIISEKKESRTINSVRSKNDFVGAKIHNVKFDSDYDIILTDGKYSQDTIDLINKNSKAITIIDAGRVNDDVIKVCENINYIICSEDFANGVTSETLDGSYEKDIIVYKKIQQRFPNAIGIAITVGARGYICEKNGEIVNCSSYNSGLKAIDTNCAGDIFHGAFTHAIANGYSYCESLEFANVTASLSTTKTGGRDSCPELYEVENILKGYQKKYIIR